MNEIKWEYYNDLINLAERYFEKVAWFRSGDNELLMGLVVAIDTNTVREYCDKNDIYIVDIKGITYDFVNVARLTNEILDSNPRTLKAETVDAFRKYEYLYNPKVLDKEAIEDFKNWNFNTYGPGERLTGTIEHIKEELTEIEKEPHDIVEWVDVIMLAMNGALRHGHEPQDIIDAFFKKLEKNKARKWQNWQEVPEGQPIKHIKDEDDTIV